MVNISELGALVYNTISIVVVWWRVFKFSVLSPTWLAEAPTPFLDSVSRLSILLDGAWQLRRGSSSTHSAAHFVLFPFPE